MCVSNNNNKAFLSKGNRPLSTRYLYGEVQVNQFEHVWGVVVWWGPSEHVLRGHVRFRRSHLGRGAGRGWGEGSLDEQVWTRPGPHIPLPSRQTQLTTLPFRTPLRGGGGNYLQKYFSFLLVSCQTASLWMFLISSRSFHCHQMLLVLDYLLH